jgi:dienelactone hydrolase
MSIRASFLCRLASVASALILPVGCVAEMGDGEGMMEVDEPVREAAQELTPGDPSDDTTLSNTCSWTITCSGVTAKMRWGMSGATSADCWSTAPSNMPLVMILHGNGYDYDEYGYLQAHLARNGFVSASIDVVAQPPYGKLQPDATTHQQTAQTAIDYLRSACFQSNFVNNFSVANPVDKQHFGVVGHSRGGETARYVASLLASAADFDVRAVVAMAPTRHTTQDILGTQSEGYLMLYGSSDPDVNAQSAFGAHDQAGNNDWSTPSAYDLYRSMKFFAGGTHQGFSDLGFSATQRGTTQGYVHAYLRAHLKSDWGYYEDYIRGDAVPGSFASSVFSQYSDPTARRVVDNAQRASLSPSTIGDTVTTSGIGSITLADGTLTLGTPHFTKLLVVSPNGTNGFVRWAIPVGKRDVTSFKYLSLRLGQLSGATGTNIRIGVTNSGVKTFVNLSDYGAIPQPRSMCTQGMGAYCADIQTLAHMQTFRIPLWDFGATNDVTSVELEFVGTTGNGRSFILDSVEFSEVVIIQ